MRKHEPGIWASIALIIVMALGLSPGSSVAGTNIEGYYSFYASASRWLNKWYSGRPSNYGELKFISKHSDRLESYLKLRFTSDYAYSDNVRQSDNTYYHSPPWGVAEGHIKFRGDNYETILFSRENHFWINDEPLLGLISDWKLKNDNWGPLAQGVRFEFWDVEKGGLGKWGGTVIFSDNGGTYNYSGLDQDKVTEGEDGWIARLRHRFWEDRFVSGATFLRKDFTDTSEEHQSRLGQMYNNVYGFDMSFYPRGIVNSGLHLGHVDLEQTRWTVEAATSEIPFHEATVGGFENPWLFGAEVRDIHVGNLIMHAWHMNFGEGFRDYLSGRFDDEAQYNKVQNRVETFYMVPRKAITLKLIYDHSRQRIVEESRPTGGLRPSTEWYGEIYAEYVNGFKSRVAYRSWRGFDGDSSVNDFMTYPDVFGEVSVENFLAKIRLQGRVRDVNTFRQVTAYGFDMNVNLTDKLKGYLRMLNVDEETEARHTLFAQLKYELGWGGELYFEYGDAGQSDNLVYTWFVEETQSANLSNRLALSFKTWF